jgi:hypothetical protein
MLVVFRPYIPQHTSLEKDGELAFGTQVRGFKPGRSRRIFQGEKILSMPSCFEHVVLIIRRDKLCQYNLW